MTGGFIQSSPQYLFNANVQLSFFRIFLAVRSYPRTYKCSRGQIQLERRQHASVYPLRSLYRYSTHRDMHSCQPDRRKIISARSTTQVQANSGLARNTEQIPTGTTNGMHQRHDHPRRKPPTDSTKPPETQDSHEELLPFDIPCGTIFDRCPLHVVWRHQLPSSHLLVLAPSGVATGGRSRTAVAMVRRLEA
jgi:hypothetical protein